MELHFTPEQEAQLGQIATQEGTDAERLVKDAPLRLLEEDARFRAARIGATRAMENARPTVGGPVHPN
jgi:hypothetical protein